MAGIKCYRLEHPEWLQVKKDGNFSYGYDQEWYTDAWKRLAGCGPTTATQVISYALFRDGHLCRWRTGAKTNESSMGIRAPSLWWWTL